MNELLNRRICNLISVKSLGTVILTIVFSILALRGIISGQEFLTVYTVVISFYYGTQAKREG